MGAGLWGFDLIQLPKLLYFSALRRRILRADALESVGGFTPALRGAPQGSTLGTARDEDEA